MQNATAIRIKVALIQRGIRLVDIARDLDVSGEMVGMVVNGHRATPRIRREIARRIGFDPWAKKERKK